MIQAERYISQLVLRHFPDIINKIVIKKKPVCWAFNNHILTLNLDKQKLNELTKEFEDL